MSEGQAQTFQERMAELARLVGGAQALAEKAGLSRRVVGKYLAGESDPSRERLVALADAAGVSVEWLAAGRGPKLLGEKKHLDPEVVRRIREEIYGIYEPVSAEHPREVTAPIRVEDLPMELMRAWIADFWRDASPDLRTWLKMDFERHYPEFAEWKKNGESKLGGQCGA